MAKSSADLKKEAATLRAKLAAVQKEARKMKRLEDLQAAEEQHQRDIQFALEFVQMAKEMYFRDGNRSYYDYISEKMAEKQAAEDQEQKEAWEAEKARRRSMGNFFAP